MRRISAISFILALSLAGAACEQVKSYNPLSPNIAGPIPWVQITVPRLLQPAAGQKFRPDQQPISLLIENSSSNGPRPLYYTVEIAADSGFTNLVFSRQRVQPGDNGQTSLRLDGNLQVGRTYFWRARAEDGANTGPYAAVSHFEVEEPVVIQAPVLVSPISGMTIPSLRPQLVVNNAARSGPHGTLFYQFEIGLDQAMAARIYDGDTGEGPGQTTATPHFDMPLNTLLYWRVRVTDGQYSSPWASPQTFRTPATPPAGPPPPSGPPPPGGTASCGPPYPGDGEAVVACVAATYPERLVAGVSLSERESNMEFLRDRVIEVGICGGLDLAWNLKRGVGPHSTDAIAWKLPSGFVEVVDIGVAFDDTSIPLELSWQIVAGPPGYDPYFPRPSCDGGN